jgi:exonuclease SbcC
VLKNGSGTLCPTPQTGINQKDTLRKTPMAALLRRLFKSRTTKLKTPAAAVNKQLQQAEAAKSAKEDRDARIAKQLEAVQGMPAQTKLAELAIGGLTAEVRSRAASDLRDEDLLHDVIRQAKGRDKGVFQIVRQTLQQLRDVQAAQNELEEKRQQLIQQAQDQARSEDNTLYEPRLDTLIKQWKSVETDASNEQITEFLSATHQCRERIRQVQQQQLQKQQQDEKLDQRKQTLTLLDETLIQLKTDDTREPPTLTALDALLKTQLNRWLEASENTDVSAPEQSRYNTASAALRAYVEAHERLTQVQEQIAKLATNAVPGDGTEDDAELGVETAEQAKALLVILDWPTTFPQPEPVIVLQTLAKQRKKAEPVEQPDLARQNSLSADLDRLLTELDSALENKQLKPAKQLLKNVQQITKKLDSRHQKPFFARMQLLQGQCNELSDWQGFATTPKQIALCEQMEHLAEQPIDPEAKAAHIKELQEEWKNLGGSSDRLLWARFRQASDAAYEPCKAYFAAKSDLKHANLATRQLICQQLQEFVAQADWSNIDWKVAERIHQTARQEWKAAWPVEFRDNRPLQKKFDELLKQLDAKLNDERQRNEALKQAIVTSAEELISAEPLTDAMVQAKELQGHWQAIGITRHREDRKLWQAFRQACDAIFARREQENSLQKQAVVAADEQVTNILERADQALSASTNSDELNAIWTELATYNPQTLSTSTRDRYSDVRQRLHTAKQRQELVARLQQWTGCIQARGQAPIDRTDVPFEWTKFNQLDQPIDFQELTIRTEILADQPSPAADQRKRLEIQVQRLAQSIGAAEQSASPFTDAEKLVALWCLAPASAAASKELEQRMVTALESLV